MSCECLYTKNETNTSILEIQMDRICTKTIKNICADIESWIYSNITGKCERVCEIRCSLYRKNCISQGTISNKTIGEIILGYTPTEIFKPISSYIENEDGTSKFTISLDEIHTECFRDIEIYMKELLCHRATLESNRILEELMEKGKIDKTKTREEMIMGYEPMNTEINTIEEMDTESNTPNLDLNTKVSNLESENAILKTKLNQILQEMGKTII